MQPTELIAGKYRIDRVLGRGGMGVVAAATNTAIDQQVALKFLLPDLMSDATVVERFLREARAAARLRNEHVCLVYDVGHHGKQPFIVMELLDGTDLASMVSTHVKLPVATAADYILQVTHGLAEAHALGIVHRDLKPANLFLTKRLDGTPLIKVLDFGIAKAPSDKQFNLTRTAAVMGSPGYMSPEQLRSSRDADPRSDIWALGVILFELTGGRPPFIAESITELTLKVAMDPTPALPGVPPAFERVVARCLEKDAKRRFRDVGELAAALAPFGTARAAELAEATANMLQAVPNTTRSAMQRSESVPLTKPEEVGSSPATTLGASASSLHVAGKRPWRAWSAALAMVAAVSAAVTVIAMRPARTAETVAPTREPGVPAREPGVPAAAREPGVAPPGVVPVPASSPVPVSIVREAPVAPASPSAQPSAASPAAPAQLVAPPPTAPPTAKLSGSTAGSASLAPPAPPTPPSSPAPPPAKPAAPRPKPAPPRDIGSLRE